jgi:hypothetical protein
VQAEDAVREEGGEDFSLHFRVISWWDWIEGVGRVMGWDGLRVAMVNTWKVIPTILHWLSLCCRREISITMFKVLRELLAVTAHVRSHDGHREVWKFGSGWRVVPRTLYDFRLAL